MSEVRLTVTVGASVERVFAALTEPELLERWIAARATVELAPDGAYDYGWRGGGPVKIRSVEPNRLLEYVWRFGDEPETVVRWELDGSEGQTQITLVHAGFRSRATRARYEQGWTRRIEHLRLVASSSRPVPVVRVGPDATIVPDEAHDIASQSPPIEIANISLNTDDLDANRRFYVDFLGLGIKGEYPKMLALEGNLVIDAAHGNPSTWSAHIMLLSDDLDAIKQRADELGYPCGRFPSGHLSLRDPDGRMVEIMHRTDWTDRPPAAGKPGGAIDFS